MDIFGCSGERTDDPDFGYVLWSKAQSKIYKLYVNNHNKKYLKGKHIL